MGRTEEELNATKPLGFVRHSYNVLPVHTPDEFARLKGLIREHGFNPGFPITLYEGAILDGWHRYQACLELDVEPVFRELDGTDADARALVEISMGHRNLSTEQRAAVGVALLGVERERAKSRIEATQFTAPENFPEPRDRREFFSNPATDRTGYRSQGLGDARDLAGEAVGVSGKTVEKAAQIAEQAPDVFERMKQGEYGSVERARRVAEMPDEQRAEVHGLMDSGIKAKDAEKAVKPHVANNSGDNEWYTPPEYLAAARRVLGGVDLDPASSPTANKRVQATRFYTHDDDGLSKPWSGRVWMNPPYAKGLIDEFAAKFAGHVRDGDITGIVLVNNATDTRWFAEFAAVATAMCLPTGRVRFLKPDGKRGAPLQGQAVLYFGPRRHAFFEEFRSFGHVWGTP